MNDSSIVRVAVVTFSDTRTRGDDEGGDLLEARLVAAGFQVPKREIVREDDAAMVTAFDALLAAPGIDAIVTTGGTGIAPRDRAFEVIVPRLDKVLDGFGEAFRRLSWNEVGARAILSRAVAGTRNGRVIVALPGSPAAVKLAVDELLAPTLSHMAALASGRGGKHAQKTPSQDGV